MNMIDFQDKLKNLSDQQLIREMQSPSGDAPQFLVLSEITRRKRMRDSFQNQQAQPTTSIAEEAVASAGVPGGGLAAMARSLAPNSSMAQNTAAMPSQPMPEEQPVQGMYGGGPVRKMQDGGYFGRSADEDDWLLDMLNPVVGAEQSVRDYQEGDYPGAMLNAASAFPFTKGLGLAGKGALTIAPEVYEYLYPEKEERRPLRPNTMSGGGYVKKMAGGMSVNGQPADMSNPMVSAWVRREAQRRGVSIEEVLASLGPTGEGIARQPQIKADRNRMLDLEPTGEGMGLGSIGSPMSLPTQPDLDQRYADEQRGDTFRMPPQSDLDRRFLEDQFGINSRPMTPQPLDSLPDIFPPAPREGRIIGREPPAFQTPPVPQMGQFPSLEMEPPVDLDLTQGGYPQPERQPARQAQFEPPTYPDMPEMSEDPGPSPLDRQGNLLFLQDEIKASRMGPMTGLPEAQSEVEKARAAGTPAADEPAVAAQPSAPDGMRPKPNPNRTPPSGGGITTDDPDVPATPNPSTSVTGRGSGAAVGGSNAPTSYEQELRDAMIRAEKRASQDKWLALAQVGMQLMSSKEPTLGGALGEAGIAGLQAYRGSRDDYENERLGLSKSLFDLQQQQAAALAAQRAAAAKAAGKPLTPDQEMSQIEQRLKFLVEKDDFGGEAIMPGADGAVAALRQRYTQLLGGGGGGTFDATAQ